ncbi:MAG: pyridoxal phosphate-dependent aminotransferase [Spirochaetaceae bacterium]|jgi:aspartate aminotransferase|nr:pyridoxal phosphate-dependent aminotransferase [Spirochaetaceae bacterium]
MPVSENVRSALMSSSMIRKMFEEGLILKKTYGTNNVFDFSLGNPDIDPPASFCKVLAELAALNENGIHGYMPNAGYFETREALAAKASYEHKVKLTAHNIVMSAGAAGALNVAFKAILNSGDEVIVPNPYFMEYKAYVANHQGKLVAVSSKADFDLDIEAVNTALSEKTAAVLINSPHNPTGRVYSQKSINELSHILELHGKITGRFPYLIADEPYRDIVYDGLKTAPVLCGYNNSMAITSYSKSLSLPGERIGYIAVNEAADNVDELMDALVYTTRTLGFVNAPALMQRCVAKLTDEMVDSSIYARRRAVFMRVLDAVGLEYIKPEGTFYIFVKVPVCGKINGGSTDDVAFAQALKKELILGVPGKGFGMEGWIRFAYCVSEKLIEASQEAFQRAVEAWKMS